MWSGSGSHVVSDTTTMRGAADAWQPVNPAPTLPGGDHKWSPGTAAFGLGIKSGTQYHTGVPAAERGRGRRYTIRLQKENVMNRLTRKMRLALTALSLVERRVKSKRWGMRRPVVSVSSAV